MSYTLKNVKVSPFSPAVTSLNVTSDFGPRTFKNTVTGKTESGNHSGIDVTNGTTIVAIADGTVTAVRDSVKGYDESKSSGNYVTISHGNKTYSTYCHMALGSIKVKVGDTVKKGQVLGTKGATGHATGPHLHLGIKYNGSYVDPKPYLLGEKAIGTSSSVTPEPTPAPTPAPSTSTIKPGDTVVVNGVGTASSYGTGKKTRKYTNTKMKVIIVNNTKGIKNKYALNQYNKGTVNNGRDVTGWFNEKDVKKV